MTDSTKSGLAKRSESGRPAVRDNLVKRGLAYLRAMQLAAASAREPQALVPSRAQSELPARSERVLQFPRERSLGSLGATDPTSGSHRSLGEARGTVRALVELRIHLAIHLAPEAVTDLSPLRDLGQDDLWSIDLCKEPVTDDQLHHLAGLTGLRALYLSKARSVTDAGVAHFAALTSLQHLDLYATRVTDAGLVHFRGMTDLEELHLGNTRVGNAGLVHLRDLRRLKELNLHGTDVTDEGVPILEGMTHLKLLWLWGTTVTLEALEGLKISLPACDIRFDYEGRGLNFHALASAAASNPADATCLLNLGRALVRNDRPHRAIPLLRQAICLNPKLWRGWLALVRALESDGKPDEAAKAMPEAARACGVSEEELARMLNKE